MVLASCTYMLTVLVEQLKSSATPFHNPYRLTNGAWNPLTAGAGKGRTNGRERLIAFLRASKEVHGDSARLWTMVELQILLKSMLKKRRSTKEPIFNDPETVKNIIDIKNISPSLVDTETLKRIFTLSALKAMARSDLNFLADTLSAAALRSIEYPREVFEAHGYEALTDTPRIIVGTIHSVKGGQCDDVYICPDIPYRAYQSLALGNSDAIKALYRQFYVAMTRARHGLYLCQASTGRHVPWRAPYLEKQTAAKNCGNLVKSKVPTMLKHNPHLLFTSRRRG